MKMGSAGWEVLVATGQSNFTSTGEMIILTCIQITQPHLFDLHFHNSAATDNRVLQPFSHPSGVFQNPNPFHPSTPIPNIQI